MPPKSDPRKLVSNKIVDIKEFKRKKEKEADEKLSNSIVQAFLKHADKLKKR